MKLNQLIAIVTGEKTQTQKKITALYKKVQNGDLFSGISRYYTPKDDEGDKLPPESKKVQLTHKDVLDSAQSINGELWNLIVAQDITNCNAYGDIIVDGDNVLLEGVPVTSLMYLEKQLVDLRTLVEKIPKLDPAEEWKHSVAQGTHAGPVETFKTKKVPRNHVKAEATKEHPAQVEVYMEDIVIGTWSTLKFSGAMAPGPKALILAKIDEVIKGVKYAREEANQKEVGVIHNVSKVLFEYIRAQS